MSSRWDAGHTAAITLSTYQQAILDEIVPNGRNILVQARAGAGKSFVLKKTCDKARPFRKSRRLLAFNKPIAQELKDAGYPASTFNAEGYRVLLKAYGDHKPNGDKVSQLVARMMSQSHKSVQNVVTMLVDKAYTVGLVPAQVADKVEVIPTADTREAWVELIDRFNIDVSPSLPPGNSYNDEQLAEANENYLEKMLQAARAVMAEALTDTSILSFNDQILLPVIYNLPTPKYDFLAVDEVQDVDPVQILFIRMLMAPGCQFVGVGDRWQSLYGFRGASRFAMDEVAKALHCTELQMPITYRCSLAVVREAQIEVPDLQARPGAPEGQIKHFSKFKVEQFEPDDLAVCRMNGPLVGLALKLLKKRIPFSIAGRDFFKSITDLVNKIEKGMPKSDDPEMTELGLFQISLASWAKDNIKVAEDAGRKSKATTIRDLQETMEFFVEATDGTKVADLRREIDTVIRASSEGPGKVKLSSIHRAKGTQAEYVFWLDSHLGMSPREGEPDWPEDSEDAFVAKALSYVAKTRAITGLAYIYGKEIE